MEGSPEVPSYFLCPISLEIMRDPVTLATGITYDRTSIERWVFAGGHATCPVTKQQLGPGEREGTPNHTLRRLIQGWCAANAVERFPTPRPPVDADRVAAIVDGAWAGGQQELLAAIRELKAIAGESERNKRCVEGASGAVDFLVSVVTKHITSSAFISHRPEQDELNGVLDSPTMSSPEEEALCILYSLKLSEQSLAGILERSDDFLAALTSVLRHPSYRSRTYGIHLLKALVSVMAPTRLTSASAELLEEVVRVVADQVSAAAVKAALHVLCRLCPWGRNRVKAVEAGAVAALVELLLDERGRRTCELALLALEHLCGCADGRSELVAHPAGLAVMAKKVMRVSALANESAVRALHAVARCSATPAVLQEMLAVGVVAKLLFVLQVDAGDRWRKRAKEVLKMHARVWKGSPCLREHLQASYPC